MHYNKDHRRHHQLPSDSCRTDMSSMLPECENNKIATIHTTHSLWIKYWDVDQQCNIMLLFLLFSRSAVLHGGSHLYYVHRVIFLLCFRVSSLSPTMWSISQLISLCLLWQNWILCISGIYGHCASNGSQLVLESIRHVVSGQNRVPYSSRELKAIRTSMPRTRLPTEVWECIFS